MRILLIGASGMIGSRVLAEAVARGHSVIAAARHLDRIPVAKNVEVHALDATDSSAVSALLQDADVVVTSVSPRGGGDPLQEAMAVANAVISALKDTDKRLLVVGGAGSLNFPDGRPVAETLPDAYRGEALAMRAVRDRLKASDLVDWTFFSPPAVIVSGERTGHYRLGTTTLLFDDKGESRISAEDYAHALVDELEAPRNKRAQMTVAY